jgi:hypothetical protein
MNPEIFSILSNALERADKQNKTPCKPHKTSGFEQKVIETLRLSSEYKNYVEDNLVNGVAILMKNDKDFIYKEIAKLSTLSIGELRQLWKEKTHCDAPQHWAKNLLVEELTNLLQRLAFGDLAPADRELLNEHKDRLRKGMPLFDPCKKLPIGMVLTKDYNGYRHVVKILENEQVEYEGKVHKSLSAVARVITGVRWNGREFFHVEKREKARF